MRDHDRPPTQDVLVIADDREPGPVLQALRALPRVRVSVKRLALGDYRVDDRLLVERKSLQDFSVSVIDGRLFSQAKRLAASAIPTAIILEGTAADLSETGIRREALQGAMVSLSLIFGIPILRSRDPNETARLILYAANQLHAVSSGVAVRRGWRPRGKRRTQIAILQGLPGVGPRRAKTLLERFGSVQGVLTADPSSLEELPGIGAKIAAGIRWAVTEAAAGWDTEATRPSQHRECSGSTCNIS